MDVARDQEHDRTRLRDLLTNLRIEAGEPSKRGFGKTGKGSEPPNTKEGFGLHVTLTSSQKHANQEIR